MKTLGHRDEAVSSATEQNKQTATTGIDLARLRAALLPQPLAQAVRDNAGSNDERGLVAAAVLFPIVLRAEAPSVLLTRRTDQLRDHAGQISFPGGRVEDDDASLAQTALRETREEVGLDARHIDILGYLPEYRTVTGFRITPVVAYLHPPFVLTLDQAEVAEAFEVPLSFILDPVNQELRSREHEGKLRRFFAISYGSHFIWGATAGIIVSLTRAMEQGGSAAALRGDLP